MPEEEQADNSPGVLPTPYTLTPRSSTSTSSRSVEGKMSSICFQLGLPLDTQAARQSQRLSWLGLGLTDLDDMVLASQGPGHSSA